MIATYRSTMAERLCHNIRVCNDGCWYWMGALDAYGYGTLGGLFNRSKKTIKAHRLAYETFNGPISGNLPLDHICQNHRCVNPEHLQPVTLRENNRRHAQRRTHCKNGHPWMNLLTIRKANGKQEHWCRECNKIRCVKAQVRRRAMQNMETQQRLACGVLS